MNRRIDPSQLWLVAIKDKELLGEPYVAFAVVEAVTGEMALRAADPSLEALNDAGRGRCHAVLLEPGTMPFKLSFFYKTSRLNPPDAQHEIECLKVEIERMKEPRLSGCHHKERL